MAQGNTLGRARWVDLGTSDPQGAQQFYSQLFGWRMDVTDDPQYGGYAIGVIDAGQTAGIGGLQDPGQPTVWSLYIGTQDIDALTELISREGGSVVAPPFAVGDQGRMAIYSDPGGAVISAWQGEGAGQFVTDVPGAFSWGELNARGVQQVIPFYERVFGWTTRVSDGGDQPYYEFQLDGQSVLGAIEMPPELPAEVPPNWMIYFDVEDVDAAFQRALELGGQEIVPPGEFPGGRFAIVTDPQGATFGLLKVVQDV
jgi:predicted enzyme related to lactoylglutathione lyase